MTRTTRIALAAIVAVAMAGVAIGLTTSTIDRDEPVTLDQVPQAARQTIEQRAAGGVIEEIERSVVAGQVIFEVEVRRLDGLVEFIVAENGTYLGLEDDDDDEADDDEADDDEADDDDDGDDDEQEIQIDFADAPAAVQEAFAELAGGDVQPTEVEQTIDDGFATYEIEYSDDAGEVSIILSAEGELIAIKESIGADTLPPAVLDGIQAKHPGATIQEAEQVQVIYYELELVVGDKTFDVVAMATGEIGGDDDDDDDGDDHD